MGKKDEKDNSIAYAQYEVQVSVRQFVEFLHRSGDINNVRTTAPEEAMQEGSRLHRMLQKRMGEEYSAEVLLRHCIDMERYSILIEGRADGIIQRGWDKSADMSLTALLPAERQHLLLEDFDEVTIDEIKCIGKQFDTLAAPVEVHLAQAKVYAYIYSKQKKLPLIRVRMTYCQFETEELKYFLYEYTYRELEAWFTGLIEEYRKWSDFQYDWSLCSRQSMRELTFPFPYREGQRDLAVYVYRSIKEKKKLYLEAPTGVGKTVTSIFPAVKAFGEGICSKIFYLTAKTITRTVAEDTFTLMREKGLKLKSITLTAKEKVCILGKPDCNPQSCERAKGHFDRINAAIYAIITECDRIDRETLLEYAQRYQVCPFEYALDISLFMDGIICDYNYVFDPHAYLRRYFAEGARGDYVFLIDEAHNLVERGRNMFSAILYKEDFLRVKRSLREVIERQPITKRLNRPSNARRLEKALDRCNRELLELKRTCENCRVLESADKFVATVESLHQAMTVFLDEEEGKDIRQEVLEFYFEISHFLLIYEKLDPNYCIYCELQEDQRFFIKLLCVNPANNLKEAMARGRSSILFSATFLPIQYYKGLLGGEKTDYEAYAKSTFDPSQRGLFIAKDVTSKYSRRGPLEYHKIASYLYQAVNAKKGNYMMFFPSYQFMQKVHEAFMQSFYVEKEMECICQEENMKEEDRENFLGCFTGGRGLEAAKSLIGFCVLGGIFSEGIDLKEDSLIGCLVVGTGLPQIGNEKELLRQHFDEQGRGGFDYAYRYPGMNKVLQSAGRVIRTAQDIGVVLLLDERFLENSYRRLFPREWSNYQVVDTTTVQSALENFWNLKKLKK